MVIKVFLSGISASKEVKKRQQRTLLILDSCKVDYEMIDITEPGMEEEREFMQQNCKVRSPNKTAAAPQFFNDVDYCGDYEDFDSAVEVNHVLQFLKLEAEAAAEPDEGVLDATSRVSDDEEIANGTHDDGKAEDEEA